MKPLLYIVLRVGASNVTRNSLSPFSSKGLLFAKKRELIYGVFDNKIMIVITSGGFVTIVGGLKCHHI